MSGYTGLVRTHAGRSIDLRSVGVFTVPNRSDAEGHRPVGRVLIDGGISIISKLIAVILKGLAERTQHRPRLMARGARQPIFARERRKRSDTSRRRQR